MIRRALIVTVGVFIAVHYQEEVWESAAVALVCGWIFYYNTRENRT